MTDHKPPKMQNYGTLASSHGGGLMDQKPILPRGIAHQSNNQYTNVSDSGGLGVQGTADNSVLSHLNL